MTMAAILASEAQKGRNGSLPLTMGRLFAALALLLLLLGGMQAAQAHPMPDSKVGVRILEDRVRLHLSIPADRLAMALIANGSVPDPGPGFTRFPDLPQPVIARYVLDNLWVGRSEKVRWPLRLVSIKAPMKTERDYLVEVEAQPQDGSVRTGFEIAYGVVVKHVVPDVAIATLDQDWSAGQLPGQPQLLGNFEADSPAIAVRPGQPNTALALFGMVKLGAWHILEGADHLAFLLTLLLTVGLIPLGRRWIVNDQLSRPVADTLWRVSAFTLGHTLALLATSLGWLPEAGRLVEALIAFSVMVSAANAVTPLFPRREAFVAGGFGLVHGMAFATVIRDMGLATGQVIASTLAFNVGIELVQIGLIAVALPALLMIRKTRFEAGVRIGLGAICFLLACWWLFERTIG